MALGKCPMIGWRCEAAEGKTKKEAVRSLKRQVSNAIYCHLLLDAR